MRSLLAGFCLVLLVMVVRRWRVRFTVIRPSESSFKRGVPTYHLIVKQRFRPEQRRSKSLSARPDSLGRAIGLLRRFNASQAAILRRLGANGIKESSGTSTGYGKSPRPNPIRDY